MKKLVLATLVTFGVAASQGAFSADNSGTVTITGEVIETTCKLKTNDDNKTVVLPKVPTSALTTAGDVAGTQPFTLTITNCTAAESITQGGISWDVNSTNVNTVTGNLKNIATGGSVANNVEIQLLNDAGSAITIGDGNINYVTLNKAETTDETVLKFRAQYYATAQSTAGDVRAVAPFSVVYN